MVDTHQKAGQQKDDGSTQAKDSQRGTQLSEEILATLLPKGWRLMTALGRGSYTVIMHNSDSCAKGSLSFGM